jgi:hypothetical protein
MSDKYEYFNNLWSNAIYGNKQSIEEYYGKVKHTEKKCSHEWKAIKLVYSTVYDCKHCGIKQEDDK